MLKYIIMKLVKIFYIMLLKLNILIIKNKKTGNIQRVNEHSLNRIFPIKFNIAKERKNAKSITNFIQKNIKNSNV